MEEQIVIAGFPCGELHSFLLTVCWYNNLIYILQHLEVRKEAGKSEFP